MHHLPTRVAAYGICRRDDQVLLAHWIHPTGLDAHWTLPGGQVEHTEDPIDAVVREVDEETGYDVRVDRLLGIDSRSREVDWSTPSGAIVHFLGIYYAVTIIGGELRDEVGGSTDTASWFALADVAALPRAVIVDLGLTLDHDHPPTGHTPAVDPDAQSLRY